MAKIHTAPGFGALIREARIKNSLSQSQLAEMIGTTQSNVSAWERGSGYDGRTVQAYDKMIELLEIHREEPPRVAAPVAIPKVTLTTPEDEFSYSPRKLLHSAQYMLQNLPRLIERLEKSAREVQRLEQSQGITQEELAVLRDKARRYDQMQELIGKKQL